MVQTYPLSDIAIVVISEPEEILGMGGPWVSCITINTTILPGKYLAAKPLLYKNRYIIMGRYYAGKWRSNCFFKISFYDLQKELLLESNEQFPLLFIEDVLDERLVYLIANHNNSSEHKRELDLSFLST